MIKRSKAKDVDFQTGDLLGKPKHNFFSGKHFHRFGKDAPFYGKHWKEENKKVLSLANSGENNGMWKGDKVGVRPLHLWVKKFIIKPKLCSLCKIKPAYDLANITGIYSRDLKNWKYLCRRCHMLSDGRMKNLKQYANQTK
jgi:hypothetical protein